MAKKHSVLKILKKVLHFYKVVYKYLKSIPFITVAISALILITFNSWLFYEVELEANPKISNFFDCFYWAVTTTTTVGYGDTTPVTTLGKIVGMFAMVTGALMFAIFTGLFAQSLFQDDEINELFSD